MKIFQFKNRKQIYSGSAADQNLNDDYVGIDCIALPKMFSGAAYYIYYFTLALLSSERRFPIAIICKPAHAHLFNPSLKAGDKIVTVPLKNRLQQLLFYEYKLPELLIREKITIFHAMHYITPPRSIYYKTISTFHDMGFFLYPDYYSLIKKLYFGLRIPDFIARSDLITAVSETTQKSIGEIFPESQSKLRVINPGLDHLNHQPVARQKSKYILAVNAFEKRKNIPFLIDLYDVLKENYDIDHQLILIGSPGNDYKNIQAAIKRSAYKKEIILLHSISSMELASYYTHADFFINASGYEGFGFTPFEAIRLSCPAFIYNNNVTQAMFRQHKYLLNHLDVNLWAEFIVREMKLKFPNKINESLVSRLTWERTAEQTLFVYSELIHKEGVLVA